MAAMTRQPVAHCIQRLLKGSGERVLFCELIRNGGQFSTNGISFERFSAVHCLIGHAAFASSTDAPLFNAQTIPLTGFEDWLRLGVIKVEQTDDAITANYKTPDDVEYSGDDGTLSLILDVEAEAGGMLGTYAYSLKQTAHARLSLNTANTLSADRLIS
jgi:ApeA N-terminal domain 1